MHGALAYTGMCRPPWNTYYFNSLVVSTIHGQKKLWIGVSKLLLRQIYLLNVQSFASKITLLSLIHTRFLFSFPIKLLIRLG